MGPQEGYQTERVHRKGPRRGSQGFRANPTTYLRHTQHLPGFLPAQSRRPFTEYRQAGSGFATHTMCSLTRAGFAMASKESQAKLGATTSRDVSRLYMKPSKHAILDPCKLHCESVPPLRIFWSSPAVDVRYLLTWHRVHDS